MLPTDWPYGMLAAVGMSVGKSLSAALSAACTSRAAPSMLRLKIELYGDTGLTQGSDRGELGDAGNLAKPPLQWARRRLPP